MKPLKVSSTLHTEQEHFLQEFEPTLKSEVEKMGGQLEAFYSRHNPGVVQAYSVKFSDSPVAVTVYPVSYTHLDVYKRQVCANEVKELGIYHAGEICFVSSHDRTSTGNYLWRESADQS